MTTTEHDDWVPVSRVRAHEQVMAQIEQRIVSGQLGVGDHLPSERDLALLLGVSRPSLRESLRVLEALGVLDIRRGGGPDGGAVLTGTPGDGAINPLRLQLALGHFTHRELLDTRLALESWSCENAAKYATDDDLVELEAILARMEEPGIPTEQFNALDAAFHVRIAEASGNTLTGQLMHTLRAAINRQMVDAYSRLDDWQTTADVVRHEHRGILAALTEHDGESARARVLEHIRSFYATVDVDGFERRDGK